MVICKAQQVHIPGMLNLLKQVGQVHHDIRPDIFRDGALKYDTSALAQLLTDPNSPIFVSCQEDKVLGYCFCQWRDYRGSGVQTDRLELYIDDLCVDETCRGKGIATALYNHVTAYARAAGCSFISLNVWCGNDTAQRFYAGLGMTPRSVTMEQKLEDI